MRLWSATMWGSIIFPCSGKIFNLKFTVSHPSVILGVNHLSMSKLNPEFKIFSEFLVGNNEREAIIIPFQSQIFNLRFSVTFWSVTMGVNHLSMSNLNLKFKIFSEILVGKNDGGNQSSFHVQDWSLKFKIYQWDYWSVTMGGQSSFHVQAKSLI